MHNPWCVCVNCMATIEAEDRPDGFNEWQDRAPWNRLEDIDESRQKKLDRRF